ncbi:MAG TPA: hypothetical protein VFT65_09130 [Candidatus Angelobacter sp.]|nr:hypothetical protein [Candidatus Angelobacter sp.]
MKKQSRILKILSTTLIACVWFSQSMVAQQGSNPASPQQQPETAQQPAQSNMPASQPASPAAAPANSSAQSQPQQNNNPGGTSVNPSQGPLQPVTTYPDASGAQQQEQPAATTAPAQTGVPDNPRPKRQTEPVGAASAESVPTAGGAAAKPAGVAIAPAKQHQTRSLLLKIGAVVAAGAAVGTVYALSRGTPSTPPGTGLPGVTAK